MVLLNTFTPCKSDRILPYQFITHTSGNRSYRLAVPVESALKAAWNNGSLHDFPYWGKCWPAALALSEFLVKNTSLIQDKTVIEFAAGLGLPSLVAATYARNIICSDYLPEPLSFVNRSAAANGISNITTSIINWHHLPADLKADIVLLSDVNYDPADFDALDRLLSFFLQQDSLIILSTPQRIMARSFVEKWMPFQIMQEVFAEKDVSVWVLGSGGDRKSGRPKVRKSGR